MTTRTFRIGCTVSALVLASGCGSGSTAVDAKPTASATPTSAAAATYTVGVDGNISSLALPVTESQLAFFPKAVSVHPGDTVSFGLNDSGEPHTVALGALVNAAAAAVASLPPQSEPPPAAQALLKKVPDLLPQGPGDAFQAAAQACYLTVGVPVATKACSVKSGDFTGAESLVSSGWLDPNAPFTLKISDAAKPGTYNFYCQLHGPSMGGTLTVADKATVIPTPDEATATGLKEATAAAAELAPGLAQLASATAANVIAGNGVMKAPNGLIDAFGPKDVKIPVGGAVTWKVFGPHSIAFNAPADAQALRQAAPDGSVHLNPKAVTPVGGPGGGPKPGLIDGGTWNGVGVHSSGIILSFPPELSSYRLRFSKAGTYTFLCTVHTQMKGSVTVG